MTDKQDSPARWDVPAIDGGDGRGYMTAGRLEELQDEAYQEGFKRGYEDGKSEGAQAVTERAEQLRSLLDALAAPFDQLDSDIADQVVELAMSVTRQLFRREMKTEPEHVIGVVREAVQLLPSSLRDIRVHLHPEDADLIRETLMLSSEAPAWTIVEEPLITRGGCRVSTEHSRVDATVESRLNAAIAAVVGDERHS